MDADLLTGTLDVMAKGVERAGVVVVCMTRAFKESATSRTEAECASCVHTLPIRGLRGNVAGQEGRLELPILEASLGAGSPFARVLSH